MKLRILLLSVVALFGACKSDRSGVDSGEVSIDLSANVESINTAFGVSAKSIITGTTFASGDQLGVYIVPMKDATNAGDLRKSGNYRDNLLYGVKADLSLDRPTNAVYPNSLVKVDMYGFYPYNAAGYTLDAGNCVAIVKNNQSAESDYIASDFMTAFYEGKNGDPNPTQVNLKFYHRLSKVTVLISTPASYKADPIASIKSVTLKNVQTKSLLNPKGTVDFISSVVGDVVMNSRGGTSPAPAKFEAIVSPTATAGNYEVDLILVGASSTEYKFTYQGSHQFAVGKNNTLSITTFEDERIVALGGGQILAWGDAGTIAGGDIVERGASESFGIAGVAEAVNKVKVGCSDGYTYELVANKNAANKVTFKFSGEFGQSPEKYPYTINSVEYYDGVTKTGGGVLVTAVTVSARAANEVVIDGTLKP